MPKQPITEVPRGETIASYSKHEEARAAVARLAERDFDVSALTIVGSDVAIVESMEGLRSWAAAAGSGALSGAWLGLFLGLIMALLGGDQSLTSGGLLPALLIGVGIGIIWGLLMRWQAGRRGSVAGRPQVLAGRYDIVCAPARAAEARLLLGTH
ncbi:magnesium transporter [Brevibacterium sp. 5221]|uniref:Magnesium transporter n=1 Tax=Brevibacterium rongguiense TaxID=2695267 RepID=A0A6N9H9M3_9MICO|nr:MULTISPECIES: general stress protein [Brevibacterium]MYM20790.1 magnesium transporter [Brevibacterium rongguiense]WAL40488.1 hypothetical protein BRM1_00995 [Brevibacterium sp. BRM-1]